MKKTGLLFFFLLCFGLPFFTYATQGCCSWHGGVCGSACCDGKSLSDACSDYTSFCSSQGIMNLKTVYSQRLYNQLGVSMSATIANSVEQYGQELELTCSSLAGQNSINNGSSYIPTYTPIPSYSTTNNDKLACLNRTQTLFNKYQEAYDNFSKASDEEKYEDALKYANQVAEYLKQRAGETCGSQYTDISNLQNGIKDMQESFSGIIETLNKMLNFTPTQACQDKYGANSVVGSTSESCGCKAGYAFSAVSAWKSCDLAPTNGDTTNSLITDTELQSAITWMYNNGLTRYNTIVTFMGEGYLTREQASKFFVQFAKGILGKVVDTTQTVNFSDLAKADITLQSYIREASQLGLFKGVKGKFLPFNKLTRAQAIAVIIRANDGLQNEIIDPRYITYYNIALNYGLLEGLGFDFSNLDGVNIKRKEVAILLYRLANICKMPINILSCSLELDTCPAKCR